MDKKKKLLFIISLAIFIAAILIMNILIKKYEQGPAFLVVNASIVPKEGARDKELNKAAASQEEEKENLEFPAQGPLVY